MAGEGKQQSRKFSNRMKVAERRGWGWLRRVGLCLRSESVLKFILPSVHDSTNLLEATEVCTLNGTRTVQSRKKEEGEWKAVMDLRMPNFLSLAIYLVGLTPPQF